MGVSIDVIYQGELHCEAVHGPSKSTLETDAPVDNHGRGESFSPTDLLATAFATCILTVMGLAAQKRNIELEGMRAHVEKEMVANPRRRVGGLATVISIPAAIASRVALEDRAALEQAALTCPVQESLHPDISRAVRFVWEVDRPSIH